MNEYEDMPEDLKFGGYSVTQYYIYKNNINKKPEFVSSEQFEELIKENGYENILTRGIESNGNISGKEIAIKQFQNDIPYIAGRPELGSGVHGEGAYFSKGSSMLSNMYGDYSVRAFLSKKAKIIDSDNVEKMFESKASAKQKKELKYYEDAFKKNVSRYNDLTINRATKSIKALMLGYHVIKDKRVYNVVDRSALIMERIK